MSKQINWGPYAAVMINGQILAGRLNVSETWLRLDTKENRWINTYGAHGKVRVLRRYDTKEAMRQCVSQLPLAPALKRLQRAAELLKGLPRVGSDVTVALASFAAVRTYII